MEVIESFRGKSLFLDTSLFIYYIQENPAYMGFLQKLFSNSQEGEFKLVTSVISLIEVLVLPIRNKDFELAEQYKNIFTKSFFFEVLNIDSETSYVAAKIRGENNFRTPDSIQLASFEVSQAGFFITNDKQLKKYNKSKILILDEIIT